METAIELVDVVKRLDTIIRSQPHPFFGHTVFSHPRITLTLKLNRLMPKSA